MTFSKGIKFKDKKNKQIDQEQLSNLLKKVESRDDTQLQEVIAFIEQHPAYKTLIEARYLPFIQVRKRVQTANLSMLNEPNVALTEEEVKKIKALPESWLGIDEGGDEQLFYTIVDVAGAMMQSYISFDKYKEHHLASITKSGRLDTDNCDF